jgi:ComF family protein
MKLSLLWNDFVDLIFPRCCEACDQSLVGNEETICTACRISLPRVNKDSALCSNLRDKFVHLPEVANATAFLLFTKRGKVQKLLHALKYKSISAVGRTLGQMFGQEMKADKMIPETGLIISVPLHPAKMKRRGYNQSDLLAEGFAGATGLSWSGSTLVRKRNTSSQTGKTKIERRENVKDVFVLNEPLLHKTIIVMDDVLTTGATVEACVTALKAGGAETFYIMTIAAAQH